MRFINLLIILSLLPTIKSSGVERTNTEVRVSIKLWRKIGDAFRRGWNNFKLLSSLLLQPRHTLPPPTQVSTVRHTAMRYVALGDSFAAGFGSGGGRLPIQPFDYDRCCYRNRNAYPSVLARMLNVTQFQFRACGGAAAIRFPNSVAIQMRGARRDAQLVTVTVGGNDMGYGRVLGACFASMLFRRHCLRAISNARRRVRTHLHHDMRQLNTLLRDYFDGVVLFTGYALPYAPDGATERICLHPRSVRVALNQLVAALNAAIRQNVDNFLPVSFRGRELCCAEWPYYIDRIKPAVRSTRTCSWRRYANEHVGGLYHISADGQMEYSRAVLRWYLNHTRTQTHTP